MSFLAFSGKIYSTMGKSIAHNTVWMTVASVGQKIISFAYFTILARNIGAENTGKYFFALSFTTIFVVLVDLGLNNVLIREGAREKSKLQTYLSSVLFAKIFLGGLSYLAVFSVINLMGYPIETKHLVYLSGLTMLFDSLHLSIYGVLRALGNLKYEALAITASQFLTLILGTTFLYLGLPLIFLVLAFTIPSFLNVCYAGAVLYRNFQIKLTPHWDKGALKFFARIAVPFALAAVFARVYSYADSILLSKLAGDVAVGWYSIPYKITYAFQFIPLALVAALYPKFSEYFASDKQKLALVYEQGIKYLLLVVMPIAVGIGILAKPIILSLYTPEYLNSILPLQVLLAGLVFSYISFPIGAFLNACNRQATQTAIVFFVMILNIALNFFLIPRYGVVGAAVSALAGNFVLTAWGYIIVPRIITISHWFLFKSLGQILLAASVMGAVVYLVNISFGYIIAILVGAIIYITTLFAFRALTVAQVKEGLLLIKK